MGIVYPSLTVVPPHHFGICATMFVRTLGLVRRAGGHYLRMIIIGLILLLLGLVLSAPILWTLGIIVLVVGLVLLLLGRSGHQIGGRAHYW